MKNYRNVLSLSAFLIGTVFTGLQGQTFNFILSGSQEVGTTTPNGGSGMVIGSGGYATVSLDQGGGMLSYEIHYTGTQSALTGAHFHQAAIGASGGVQIALTTGASSITGSSAITPTQITNLLAGDYYLNLHTSENTGGEMRGQVVDTLGFTPNTMITGSQETGGIATKAAGAARVTFNPSTMELGWQVAYEGFESAVTGMHFHGPAALGTNAGIEVNIGSISGLASGTTGTTTITAPQAADLQNGLWYLNIHSTNHSGGEIRGQVVDLTIVPEPSTYAVLSGLFVLGLIICRRFRHK